MKATTMFRSAVLTTILGLVAAACVAATPGARPHDMSEPQHEREARTHAREAEPHAIQYDPRATRSSGSCSPAGRGGGDSCSDVDYNPTAKHRQAAEEHRRHAADHRAAAAALRAAEESACAGVSLDDRDISPFVQIENVAGVQPLIEQIGTRKVPRERLVGAVVTLRPVRAVTRDHLQRLLNCHIARNASLGHALPDMPNCPLVPRGVEARVVSTARGFAVAIRSRNPDTAREILARARRLQSRSTQD